jgi:hypothetical protein
MMRSHFHLHWWLSRGVFSWANWCLVGYHPKQPVRRVVIESFDPQIIWFPVLDLLKVTFSCFHCITFQGIDTFKVQLINWLIDWLPVQNYLLDPLSAGWISLLLLGWIPKIGSKQ